MDKITFTEFLEIEKKLEIKIGKITSAERIPKSKKLLKLSVDFGEIEGQKQAVTNLGDKFEPEQFLGRNLPFIMNLEPSTMMGVVSEVMIMVGVSGENIELENYSLGSKLM